MKKDIVLWMRIMIFLDNSEEIHKIIRIVSSRECDWIVEKNSRVFSFSFLSLFQRKGKTAEQNHTQIKNKRESEMEKWKKKGERIHKKVNDQRDIKKRNRLHIKKWKKDNKDSNRILIKNNRNLSKEKTNENQLKRGPFQFQRVFHLPLVPSSFFPRDREHASPSAYRRKRDPSWFSSAWPFCH